MRKRIFFIIEKAEGKNIASKIYDQFMLAIILFSLAPLVFKEQTCILQFVDYICVVIFIIDYILRWITADYKIGNKIGFFKYPITPFALIDLLAILPSFNVISNVFRAFKLLRAFKVLRVFKALRFSKNFLLIARVIRRNSSILLSLLVCSIFYIIVSALFIFSIEPDSFDNFFEAIYWATTALTTVGYGDIYPATSGGRIISMISSLFGIAMVALPAGVITAGFVSEMNKDIEEDKAN